MSILKVIYIYSKTLVSVNRVKHRIDKLLKMVIEQNREIISLRKEVNALKKQSHPPVFTRKQYSEIDERVRFVEAFIDNFERIEIFDKELAN